MGLGVCFIIFYYLLLSFFMFLLCCLCFLILSFFYELGSTFSVLGVQISGYCIEFVFFVI